MQLEEAIELGKHLENNTDFILGIKHVSDVSKHDDLSDHVCVELKHKSVDVEHDVKELYYINLIDIDKNKHELYSTIISYLIKNHKEYTDIRLEMVVIKDVETIVNEILNHAIKYNQNDAIPTKLTFRFNNMYNKEILVLMQKNLSEMNEINVYLNNNTLLNYNIECSSHTFPY